MFLLEPVDVLLNAFLDEGICVLEFLGQKSGLKFFKLP